MKRNRTETNFEKIGEQYAQVVENLKTDEKTANEIWSHVRETIEATDLTHPDTIRLLYPVAARIVADNEKFRADIRLRMENWLKA